jgi:hypothetical protein
MIHGFAGLAVLLAATPGCGPVATRSAERDRATLGTVGVYSVGATPAPALAAPVGVPGQVAKGAAKGGTIGVLSGAGSGALASLACGPFAPVCAVVFVPTGAATGLVAGVAVGGATHGVHAVPTATAETIEAALATATAGRDIPAEIRRHVVDGATARVATVVDLGGDTVEPVAQPDYTRFAPQGVDTVLEIAVERIVLAGKGGRDPELGLRIDAHARLVRVADGRVARTYDRLVFRSYEAKASEWTSADSDLLASELDRGLVAIARRIGDGTFHAS